MTEEELTGHEKYLMCMGYLMHLADLAFSQGKPVSARMLAEVSSRLDEKFTNQTVEETGVLLDKIQRFDCTEIMHDIINEIENEVPIVDDMK